MIGALSGQYGILFPIHHCKKGGSKTLFRVLFSWIEAKSIEFAVAICGLNRSTAATVVGNCVMNALEKEGVACGIFIVTS